MAKLDNKLLIMDCQLLQSADRDRGMGLFLISLLKAYSESNIKRSFAFIINKNLKELNDGDAKLLEQLGKVYELDLQSKNDSPLYGLSLKFNKLKINKMIEKINTKNEIIFFIPALFSTEIYPVFPSKSVKKILLMHDIIPFLYQEQYFPNHNSNSRTDYSQRWGEAYIADMFVTNSLTTADDLIIYFGIDSTRITPIMGGGAHSDVRPTMPKDFDIENGFILMPSGDDYRKNNELAVRAVEKIVYKPKLVITSKFSKNTKRKLKSLYPGGVIFIGSVTDSEMKWLMNNATTLLFPTEYEGLGMPLLEAVASGIKVVCSDIPVFREISESAFTFFDPKSANSLSEKLTETLKTKNIGINKKEYQRINKLYTWTNTMKRFEEALDLIKPCPTKKKLAIFCPSPSSYSAVGKYVFELHAELSRYFDIDYYTENGQTEFRPTRLNILEHAAGYFPAFSFLKTIKQYDFIFYHIGNSEFHTQTILTSLVKPANALIHDSDLTGIFDYMTRNGFLSISRKELEIKLDDIYKNKKSQRITSIVNNQKEILCHSDYVKSLVFNINKDIPILKIHLPVGVPNIVRKTSGIIVSFAGIISENKGIGLIKEIASIPNIKVKVFGFGVLGNSPLLEGVPNNVEILTDLSDKQFQDNLRESNILVNYRTKYNGETSKSALEAMRYGVCVIVRDIGWFGELPDNSVVKVSSEDQVYDEIRKLIDDPEALQNISHSAREFLRQEYTYSQYAKLFAANIKGNI